MDKYIDNKLAEEMDLIVLTTNGHLREGLPRGSVGTLIESYTGHEKPFRDLHLVKMSQSILLPVRLL